MRARDRAAAGQLSLFAPDDLSPRDRSRSDLAPDDFSSLRFHPREVSSPEVVPRESTAELAPRDVHRSVFPPAVAKRVVEAATTDSTAVLRALWLRSAPRWSAIWCVPDLSDTVRVELSHRMRTSLGGFWPAENLIRVTDVLFEAPPHLLAEVLCHEAAHAAVHVLHGDRVRSHGREWKELMRKVGLEPRVRIPTKELGQAAQRAARKRWLWQHRCPICRAERLAGRPVRQWRCGPCRAVGRDGRLVITRVAATAIKRRRS